MNGLQKRAKAKLYARRFLAKIAENAELSSIVDYPEEIGEIILEELKKLAHRLDREADKFENR
jgi:hypothetical protein